MFKDRYKTSGWIDVSVDGGGRVRGIFKGGNGSPNTGNQRYRKQMIDKTYSTVVNGKRQ
jgi:hypothetical protein